MCIPYLFIDASTEGYEEEGDYEEEEEHFDNYTNQGKLIPMQAILVQASKDTIAIYLFREPYKSQVFTLQACILTYQSPFIVDLCLSIRVTTRVTSISLKFSYHPSLVGTIHD